MSALKIYLHFPGTVHMNFAVVSFYTSMEIVFPNAFITVNSSGL